MNLFELFVKIGVDDKASNKLKNISEKLGDGLKTAAKVGTAAVGAAAAGITALTTAAVNNYAEYEQLVGGVQTLFTQSASASDAFANSIRNDAKAVKEFQKANGLAVDGILGPKTMAAIEAKYGQMQEISTKAVDMVKESAANAYKTAGMSANEYMSTVTSFSASLIQSLGGDTEAAAEYADRAIISMSDNANKMGTSIDMIQNAYQGFAKQNYTMLDNLKLGYGGTKTEMERLIEDASKMADVQERLGITVDESSMSFDNIVNAIQVVQENMGIAGATALEAGTTIEGSVNSMKAAWQNLLTGISDGNADVGKLMDNFVTTIVGDGTERNLGVLGNVLPTVKTALNGIGKLIKEAVPVAMQYIPQIIGEFLPTIGEAAIGIVTSIGTAIFDNIDQILEWGQQMLDSLLEGINSNTGNISSVVTEILTTFGSFILENLPEIIMAGLSILGSLISGIIEAIPELATAATKAIIELAAYLISAENLEKIISLGADLINALSEGIENVVAELVSVGEDVVESIEEGISDAWDGLVSWFNDLWDSLFNNRSVDVNVNASSNGGGGGSFANGLSYVPYDGFSAVLHEGERVLTAEENRAYNKGASGNSSGITIIQNIQTVPQTPVEFAAATEAYFEQARWAFA